MEQNVTINIDKVRVPLLMVSGAKTPIGNNQVSMEYTGGSVLAWLVNSFSTKGPFETFKELKTLIGSPAHQNTIYDFVTN